MSGDSDGSVTFGKYKLLEQIGEGAMARVYRAVRSGPMGFRKEVALKQIRPELTRKQKLTKALINEARLGGYLEHRNIVEVHEFDCVDDTYYIAMEHVRGLTLRQLLSRLPEGEGMPPRVVAEVAVQMCEGLAYAHAASDDTGQPMNLVHRDLKPSNVIVRQDGVVKIMDFGIAKAKTNLFHTTPGFIKGTPVYMSPEQVRGDPLDQRSDIFSLGSLVAELLTGHTAFEGEASFPVVRAIAKGEVHHVVELVVARAPAFGPIIERALQLQPEDRYPSASEMADDLRGILGTLPGDVTTIAWLAGITAIAVESPAVSGERGGAGSLPARCSAETTEPMLEHVPAAKAPIPRSRLVVLGLGLLLLVGCVVALLVSLA